jgi:hypothetical protein
LQPNTLYHARVVAVNSTGNAAGADMTFITPGPPIPQTLAASGITSNAATLNAAINPGSLTTTYYFEYGLTTSYGSWSATNTLAADSNAVPVSTGVAGLLPGTLYHVRVQAVNSDGVRNGADTNFTTLATAPTVVTQSVSGLGGSNATLNASINPGGAATSCYFQYGLTTSYGNFSATNTLAAGTNSAPVSIGITGLAAGTLYHFSAVAFNSAGQVNAQDLTFTTAASASPPVLQQPVILSGGSFQFTFTNSPGVGFTALATTNLSLATNNWTVLGPAQEISPGQYQFTDTTATNFLLRFYRIRSP